MDFLRLMEQSCNLLNQGAMGEKVRVVKTMKEENKVMIQNELYLNNKDKGMLDSLQEKVVSRKLLVFLTATALMMYAKPRPRHLGNDCRMLHRWSICN